MITADFALEEGREVLAVPGEITSALSGGTNALLKLGAAPLTSTGDVLELLGLDRTQQPKLPEGPAAVVLGALADGPATADELVRRSNLAPEAVAAALIELELAGLVATTDGVTRSFVRG